MLEADATPMVCGIQRRFECDSDKNLQVRSRWKKRAESKMKPRFFVFAEGVGKIGCAMGKER